MNVVLYSAIKDKRLFNRVGFYRDDIAALKLSGANVLATNSLREVYEFKPSHIVAYFYSKSLFAALIGRLVGARVVLTGGADQISPLLQSGLQLYARQLVAFLCLVVSDSLLLSCSADIDNFKKISLGLNILKKKIQSANHVVVPSLKIRFDRNPVVGKFNAFTICWMGSVSNVRRKGVDKAIKLIALLREIGIDATLDIAGTTGPGVEFIVNLSKQLNVNEYVNYMGEISDERKNAMFYNGSVYLQLSQYEGFGVAAAEAFFSGMIVVHSNAGGLRDVIGDNGIVLDPSLIDDGDLTEVQKFYDNFILYKINKIFINDSFSKYSLKFRSIALLKL
jgi:glycosyltransferase involved in cell wall biosynthesis